MPSRARSESPSGPRRRAGLLLAGTALLLAAPAVARADEPEIETSVNAEKGFYRAERRVELTYRVMHDRPVTARVDLVRKDDGRVVRSWDAASVDPGEDNTVRWRGVVDGKVLREARYKFEVTAETGEASASSGTATASARSPAFDFYRHKFPIRGSHDYGGSGSRFGAARSGHSHQGQDISAACGTKLVAARGGRITARRYQADGAGYYVVIDGGKTDVDYVYMHLQGPGEISAGERVHTGERIGRVGNTGASFGCHLHFEMWSGPGWYEGGEPFDPLPELQAWDGWS